MTRDEMESRRLEAARELLSGVSQAEVARRFGVSRTTASRWHRALDGKGMESLRKRRAPGRPCRLTAGQLGYVREIFTAGPRTSGFGTDRWTTVLLGRAIETHFGVHYDPDHVGRIMHRLGLRTPNDRAARKSDPEAVAVCAAPGYPSNPVPGITEVSPPAA